MSTAGTDRDWPALARVVRERRLALGIVSQRAAARHAKVHINTWNALENGKPVSMESLDAIAKVLRWSTATLVAVLRESPESEPPRPPVGARALCEQVIAGTEGGWIAPEVGAFAEAVLVALDAEEKA